MGFSDKQVNALRRNLNQVYVRTREIQGRELSYLEGWHVIAEANRIFGFEGWDRQTVESKCVLARESRGTLHAVYLAKVRITVRANGETVFREGYGTGEAQGQSVGEAHEKALKTAETDATKRALATFGKPFGLALYLTGRTGRDHRSDANGATPIPDHDRRRTLQQRGPGGRYYVPPRAKTVIDNALERISERVTGGAEPPPIEPAPIPAAGLGRALGETADAMASPIAGAIDEATATAIDDRRVGTIDGGRAIAGSSAGATAADGTTDVAIQDRSDRAVPPPLSPPLQPTPGIESEPSSESGRLLIDWHKRHRDPAHLRFVAAQPCLLCGRAPSDAHHLRFAQPRALGRKVSDEFTVPLCRTHHRQLHHCGNEAAWWQAMDRDVDPLEIAKGLWEQSRSRSIAAASTPK